MDNRHLAPTVEITAYYQHEDGSVSRRVARVPAGQQDSVQPPPGAQVIDEATYEQLLTQLTEASEQARQQAAQEQDAQRHTDYQALLALGLGEDTARRLSGYTGSHDPDEPEQDEPR